MSAANIDNKISELQSTNPQAYEAYRKLYDELSNPAEVSLPDFTQEPYVSKKIGEDGNPMSWVDNKGDQHFIMEPNQPLIDSAISEVSTAQLKNSVYLQASTFAPMNHKHVGQIELADGVFIWYDKETGNVRCNKPIVFG